MTRSYRNPISLQMPLQRTTGVSLRLSRLRRMAMAIGIGKSDAPLALSYRDVEELLAEGGLHPDHVTLDPHFDATLA